MAGCGGSAFMMSLAVVASDNRILAKGFKSMVISLGRVCVGLSSFNSSCV